MLTFAWNPPESDEMYTVGIPASKLVIKRRNETPEPDQPSAALQLIFNLPHFVRINEANLRRNPVRAFETVEYDRPDHYIIPEALREAIIWASDEDFAQLQNLGFGKPFQG